MHDSEDGATVRWGLNGEALLRLGSATDVCLSCHADALGQVMGLDPLNPPPERGAGNFTFLLEDNLNDGPDGMTAPIGGNRAGHSVVSTAWGTPVDPDHSNSPGGSYPSSELGCTSCHDPHGNSNYRMLYGAGQATADGFTFTFDAPAADGPSLGSGGESPLLHVAYQRGWTNWCSNCHGLYHQQGPGVGFVHPVDRDVPSDITNVYNLYNGDPDPTGGQFSTAYLPEVPFQNPTLTSATTSGITTASRLTCVTCHRAHASSSVAAGRWDFRVLHLVDDGAQSGSYPIPNPYPSVEQRSLCNKCHWQDTQDHGFDDACVSCH
jgi:predicted CXXCH cytochrome family protein